MKPRTFTPSRLAELALLAGLTRDTVSVFGADLRALLAEKPELDSLRAPGPTDRAKLNVLAAAASTSSSKVHIPPGELRALLAEHGELEALRSIAAGKPLRVREIKARAGEGRKPMIVALDHGAERASVRTYGFDTAHLASFLGQHPETVRCAIRDGVLNPTDLASIHAYKLRVDAVRKTAEDDQ